MQRLKTSYKEAESMTEEQARKLELPFTFEEIEWRVLRVSKKKPVAQVAAYVDSRAIQKRLDEVDGRENWQNEFETVTGADNKSTAHICKLSIYYKERGEWITKSDGAGCEAMAGKRWFGDAAGDIEAAAAANLGLLDSIGGSL